MTDREILNRISARWLHLGTSSHGSHPERPAYTWKTTVQIRGEIGAIEGLIFENDREIWRFSRRLFYAKGVG